MRAIKAVGEVPDLMSFENILFTLIDSGSDIAHVCGIWPRFIEGLAKRMFLLSIVMGNSEKQVVDEVGEIILTKGPNCEIMVKSMYYVKGINSIILSYYKLVNEKSVKKQDSLELAQICHEAITG